jgi:hypothetical protein
MLELAVLGEGPATGFVANENLFDEAAAVPEGELNEFGTGGLDGDCCCVDVEAEGAL